MAVNEIYLLESEKENSGFAARHFTDSVEEATDGSHSNDPILAFSAEINQEFSQLEAKSMSKILYEFETPIPTYFRKNDWFKNEKSWKFINWCFSRCNTKKREILHDHQKIILEPFSFIFGREKCSQESFLTEGQVRTQQKIFEAAGLLIKIHHKSHTRFTIYKWNIEKFFPENNQVNSTKIKKSEKNQPSDQPTELPTDVNDYQEDIDNCNQVNNQLNNQATTKRQPSDNHKLELRNKKIEEVIKPIAPTDFGKHNMYCQMAERSQATLPQQKSKKRRKVEDLTPEEEREEAFSNGKREFINPHDQELLERVYLKQDQYDKFVAKHGTELAHLAIKKLSNYKIRSEKCFKSDYHTIVDWPLREAKKELQSQKIPRKDQSRAFLGGSRQEEYDHAW